MINSANWADLLDVPVRFRFDQAFNRRPSLIETLFNVQGSTTETEELSGVGAVGIEAWDTFEAGGGVGTADFDQGYKKTYTHKEYPLEMVIRRKLLDDGNFAQVFRIVERVGDSARVKRENDAASVFNNAFSASYLGADGVALCSDSHPLSPQKLDKTQDNNFALSLNKANVRTVRETMMAYTDDNQNKMAVTPNLLLVPPQLEDDAIEIVNSVLNPDTGTNAANPQFQRFTVQVWHYLTDSNAWFMIDSMLMKQALDWFNRVPLSVVPKVEDKTLSATWIAYMRYSFGFSDWRWVAGSNPS
jgi:phage major head subunit gpT-like protein